jgi:multidrug efflux system outer membrane protein
VGPNYKRPAVAVPTQFRDQVSQSDASSIADEAWWSVFDDPALQGLVTEALHNNYDLQVAVARIEQARALVGVAASQGKPQLGYQGFANAGTYIAQNQGSITSLTAGAFGGLLNATWEIDVWGKIRRSTEAAKANLFAQEDVRRGVLLTLVSDMAAGYFRLLELDRELAIAEESSAAFGKTYGLFDLRFKAGKDSELSVTRSRALLEEANARIPDLKRQIAQQENALSILAGVPPGPITRGRVLTEQSAPTTPVGQTTALLQRRPDIMHAEHVMVSANAEVGVAVANFYPTIGLSALAGGEGAGVGSGVHGFGLWGVAADIVGPIFSGGRLEGIYHQRKAFWDETVASYRKIVLTAFQETSDALVAQHNLVPQRAALESQVASLQRSLDIALLRYDAGRASYFEVLEAQQQLYPAEYALAQTQRDQLLAVVNLYKALGGGWKLTPEEWTQPQVRAVSERSAR